MIEYVPSRLADRHFRLAKFEGTEQPTNIYYLVLRQPGERGHSKTEPLILEFHCDCPNRRRGKHINDKHGQMMAKWVMLGEPQQGCFDEKGEWHGTDASEEGTGSASDDWEPDQGDDEV